MISEYIPLLANFNSLFELSAALNLGYASIPQFSIAVQNIFHKKLNSNIQNLVDSEISIQAKLIVVKEEGSRNIFDKNVEIVMEEVRELDGNHKNKTATLHNMISSTMNPFFIVIAFFSIFYLYLSGMEAGDKLFPTNNILTIFIALIGLIASNIFLSKVTDKSDAITITSFLIYVICIAIFGEIAFSEGVINFFDRELCVNIILISCMLPLLLTILGYLIVSFVLWHEFGSKIKRLKDKLEQNEGVLDQAKSQDGKPEKMLQNMKEKK